MVRTFVVLNLEFEIDSLAAKFSGYLYGGRPLGLSYVRYTNYGANADHPMEGTEAIAPPQDQMQ